MTKKPVNLTSHKSQIERQRRKEIRRDMGDSVRGMNNGGNIVAYAIVAFSDDGRAFSDWDTGGVLPMWAMPETVSSVLRDDIQNSGAAEDFKRPLIDRAWKGSK